jgi:pimeloyl-ACP methyl ester carboxylesterase
MTGTDEKTLARVVSRDGTEIAYWTSGEGPPLVLVHGASSNHTTWEPVLPYLEAHVTVHTLDRRGRGASGDRPAYDIAREFEDVAAVVDAVAESSGCTVAVLGHSFGGHCVFGAAALTPNVRRLVLYEGWPPPDPGVTAADPPVAERLDALLAADDREALLETFYRDVVKMSEEELRGYRALPSWRARVDAAPTIMREMGAEAQAAFDPAQAGRIGVPTLLLVGGDSPDSIKANPEVVAAALPDARILVLDDQQHIAHHLVPRVFAASVIEFLSDHG